MSRLLLTVFLLAIPLAGIAAEQEFATLQDLQVAGGTIDECRLGFRRYGEPDATGSNIVVFPSWFDGSVAELESFGKIGPGQLADSERYHVIAIDALGDGVSCSPSNSDGRYPVITIADMVRSQYRLLTEELGIDRVHAVLGVSMGGMQALQWVGQYPGFMERAVVIDGSPRMSSYDLLQWQTHKDVIRMLQAGGHGNAGIGRIVSRLKGLTLYTHDYFVESVPPADVFDFVNPGRNAEFQPDDYVAQLDAMVSHDVYQPTADAYRARVRAKLLFVGSRTDHMVVQAPARALARELGVEYFETGNNCGHVASSCAAERVNERVARFLAGD